jgi:SAM-dependent methyltransferase
MRAGRRFAAIGFVLFAALATVAAQPRPDASDQPTGPAVIDAILRLAEVTPDDVVYDLGCGDGRVLITAARKLGARGVGIDPDPELVRAADWNARLARLTDRVRFVVADLLAADISAANVVMLHVPPEMAVRLRPKLLADLKPGTRVVSPAPGLSGDWRPERTAQIGDREISLWRVPAREPGAGE